MTPLSDLERLSHILDRIERIRIVETTLTLTETREALSEEEKGAYDAILYNLLVIGEAVKSLSKEFTEVHSSVPWSKISGMRDFLAHQYFRIEQKTISDTTELFLQPLKEFCEKILSEI